MATPDAADYQGLASDLKGKVRGPLLAPGEPGYDEARSIWNAMIDRRPALILRCLGAADVEAGIRAARERGVTLCIKGGGHNIAGLAVYDGGLMLDMSLMRGVWVDPAAGVARAQAGCLLGDVDRETQLHGLAAVLGFVSNTGCAGLTLGGGFGYLSRRFGWTCDNLASIDLVTAAGGLVRASERENSDLFWGLCGGGGNFGAVTSFEYRLHAVGPEILGGAIAWRGDEAHRVLEVYRGLAANAPRELTCVAALRLAPPAPWLAKEVHGRPIVALFVCYSGPAAEGERLLAPLRALGAPVGDVIQKRPYVSQQSLLDATQPKGRRYYWKSEYLRALDPALFARAIEHAGRIVSPHSAILIFPVDGAMNEFPEDRSAAGNRDASAVLNIAAAWEQPGDDAVNIEWARTAWRDLREFSTGGTYVNFLTEEEGDDRTRAAYRTNYPRLAEIKRQWDPSNLFRTNRNVGIAIGAGQAP
jgi:FAD/FMN-containing dehydrogenase